MLYSKKGQLLPSNTNSVCHTAIGKSTKRKGNPGQKKYSKKVHYSIDKYMTVIILFIIGYF